MGARGERGKLEKEGGINGAPKFFAQSVKIRVFSTVYVPEFFESAYMTTIWIANCHDLTTPLCARCWAPPHYTKNSSEIRQASSSGPLGGRLCGVSTASEATQILIALSGGDRSCVNRLMELVYGERFATG